MPHHIAAPQVGMRLTLCCSSAAQLRLIKVSELIHNSKNHQNLDSASVNVHFARIIDVVRLSGPGLLRKGSSQALLLAKTRAMPL